jgi:hypothetical protein
MKLNIIALVFLALVLAGCGGDFASPTTTDYETTTTTTTATADMTQTHNRSVCVGFLNIGSCNTVQVNTQTQTVHRTAGAPAPAPSDDMSGAEMIGVTVLLCIGFIFCMGLAATVMAGKGYN